MIASIQAGGVGRNFEKIEGGNLDNALYLELS